MKPTWKKIAVAAGCFILLGLYLFVTHWRAKAAVEKLKAQLRAQGEKLSIADLVPPAPPGESNGVQALLSAVAQLPTFDPRVQPHVMRAVAPGRARISWTQPDLPNNFVSNVWPGLRLLLETNASPLAELRQAIARPILQFPVSYEQGLAALLPHLARVKVGSQWLSAAAIFDLHEQRPDEALENLRALAAMPQRWREEPLMIAQLVRCAIVAVAGGATWEALQYPHWRDEQLAELQSLWTALELLPQLEPSLAMERAFVLPEFPRLRISLSRFDNLMGGGSANFAEAWVELGNQVLEDPREGFDAILDRFPRRWAWKWWNSYLDETWLLQWHQIHLQAVRERRTQPAFVPIENQLNSALASLGEPSRQFLVSRYLEGPGGSSYTSIFIKRVFTAEAQRRLMVTAIALKRFEQRHGKLPADLASLAPVFLPTAPLDPMDGQPLRYRTREGEGFTLYSIGADGVDGGGNPRPASPAAKNFFWTQGPDWVWPAPASDEQVREYHVQLEQERSKGKNSKN